MHSGQAMLLSWICHMKVKESRKLILGLCLSAASLISSFNPHIPGAMVLTIKEKFLFSGSESILSNTYR